MSDSRGGPILPAHIEQTVQAIAQLHEEHARHATPVERAVERLTNAFARPRTMGLLALLMAAWVSANLVAPRLGMRPWDPPPFNWLQGVVGLLALYLTGFILITQRRDDQLAGHREQLTLELAILGEQKSAKIIQLLEEARRDDPHLRDRVDAEAEAMSTPTDPQSVLKTLQDADAAPEGGSKT